MGNFNNIGDRIKQIITAKGLTQTEFAQKLNLSPSMVSKLCSGSTEPSYRTISDICRNFGVDVIWLETGCGQMFSEINEDGFLALFMGQTLGGINDPIYRRFMMAVAESTPEELQIISNFAAKLLIAYQKETPPEDPEA